MTKTYNNDPDGAGLSVAIVNTRWNEDIMQPMTEEAIKALIEHDVDEDDIHLATVPGAYELPLACIELAETTQYDVIIAFGCVIRGETAHFDYVAGAAERGITQANLQTRTPIMFGVLTTENKQQALERALPDQKNKGREIAIDALAMANLINDIE